MVNIGSAFRRRGFLGRRYETIFCIFLVIIAFLSRDNPHFVYPHILYLFVLLLGLNLLAGLVLQWWPSRPFLSALVILANCATITGVIYYSGGQASNLWVLYLLPIYTVCILLKGSDVVLITSGAVVFNLAFYDFTFQNWDALAFLDLFVKTGVFIFAASTTWSVVNRDRRSQLKLKSQRGRMDQLESKLEEQAGLLEKTEKMADVGEISSGVAHDLNNPISVILGTVRLLKEEVEKYPVIDRDLDRIARSAELCKNIISNLLGYMRTKELSLSPIDVHDIINSVLHLYETTLNESNILVKKNFDRSLPPIGASMPHLQRVILNLLSNARQAMGKGGLIEITTREISPRKPGGGPWVEITIEDSGPGIPADVMKRIFKPFNSTKAIYEGTGLGLYLCREFIHKHDGLMNAENRPEGGARFTLAFPIAQAQDLAA